MSNASAALPTEPRARLGAMLREGLSRVGLTDPKEIGEYLADHQDYPPRRGIPYHPAVIEAWFKGELAPTYSVLETVEARVRKTVNERWLEQLEETFENVAFAEKPKNAPTELSVTLNAYAKASGRSNKIIGEQLQCYRADSGRVGVSKICVYNWCNGKEVPSATRVVELDRLFQQYHIPLTPPLSVLHGLFRRLHAEEIWRMAETENHFGKMLHACREVCGLSQSEMAEKISEITGRKQPIPKAAVCQWEKEQRIPSNREFSGIYPAEVYGRIVKEFDALQSQALKNNLGPFWTSHREKMLQQTFKSHVIGENIDRQGGVGHSWLTMLRSTPPRQNSRE